MEQQWLMAEEPRCSEPRECSWKLALESRMEPQQEWKMAKALE